MKNLMKHVLVLTIMLGMLVPAVFASGGSEAVDEGPELRELTAMVMQSRNFDGLQEMIYKLEDQENIVIDLQVVPDDQYENLIKIKLNSGEAPDIFDFNIPQAYGMIDAEEYCLDLSGEPWVDQLVNPGMSEYNGKTYAYTFLSTNGFQAMIYNKDVFAEYGLEVPTTVAEFDAVCETLKSNDVTPILLASDIWVPQIWMTSGYSRALGSQEAAQDFADKILANQAEFNDYPELAAAFDEYLSMFERGYMNDDFLTLNIDGVYDKLGSGEGAMFFGSTGLANSVELAFPDGNFGMFNLPVSYDDKDMISGTLFSTGFLVSKDSENIDTVKEVFKLWATPEYADLYFEGRPGFPAIDGVNGGELPEYAQAIYDEYVLGGRMIAEMNLFLNPLGATYGSTLWVYYQEAPSKGNMDGEAVLDRWWDDVVRYMKEQKAPGF